MTRKRRQFTAEHKQRVAGMVLDDGLKIPDTCRDQDLEETAVWRWVDQLKAERAGGPGEGQPLTGEQRRIRELERENRRLKEDKELLKMYGRPYDASPFNRGGYKSALMYPASCWGSADTPGP